MPLVSIDRTEKLFAVITCHPYPIVFPWIRGIRTVFDRVSGAAYESAAAAEFYAVEESLTFYNIVNGIVAVNQPDCPFIRDAFFMTEPEKIPSAPPQFKIRIILRYNYIILQ